MRINCWEAKHCGREPGGARAREMGVCPAASKVQYTGVNGGRAAGRVCWVVAGTFCGGKIQGSFAEKKLSCLSCDFMQRVRAAEGPHFVLQALKVA